MIHEKVSKVRSDLATGERVMDRRVIFHDLIANDQLPPEEKTSESLEDEGVGLVAAR